MTTPVWFGLAVIAVVCARDPFAQERQDRTLLSHQQMRAIMRPYSMGSIKVTRPVKR